ncbi:MAG: heavy metal translocating P-type ATPase metal-binding domain-containing protein [Candidatus Karelsulcia muelleri]
MLLEFQSKFYFDLNKLLLWGCFHCGNKCITKKICFNKFFFCCDGCLTIYNLIDKSNLKKFYELNKNPGFILP